MTGSGHCFSLVRGLHPAPHSRVPMAPSHPPAQHHGEPRGLPFCAQTPPVAPTLHLPRAPKPKPKPVPQQLAGCTHGPRSGHRCTRHRRRSAPSPRRSSRRCRCSCRRWHSRDPSDPRHRLQREEHGLSASPRAAPRWGRAWEQLFSPLGVLSRCLKEKAAGLIKG